MEAVAHTHRGDPPFDWADGFPVYDPRYVNVDGDTMTGVLHLNPPGGLAQRIVSPTDTGYIDWFLVDGSNRIGYLQHSGVGANSTLRRDLAGDLLLQADNGDVRTETPNGKTLIEFLVIDGNNGRGLYLIGSGADTSAYLSFYPDAANHNTLNARGGYVGYINGDDHLRLMCEKAGSDILLSPGGPAREVRLLTGGLRTGSTGGWQTDDQVTVQNNGRVWSTNGVAHPNFRACHPIGSSTDANGQRFIDFVRGGNTLGHINQQGTTGVNFIQTSDGRLKGDVTEVDDEAALDRIRRFRPVSFRWKCDSDGSACEDGKPTGDVERGFIAQEVDKIAPWAVSKPEAVDHLDGDGETITEEGVWGLDYGKLTPDITAAVQALDRKVTAQQQIINRQQQQIDALTAKVDALMALG